MHRKAARRGFTLLLALGTISLLILAWGMTARETVDLLRFREARDQAQDQLQSDAPIWFALARGVAQLESGDPPTDSPAKVNETTWVYALSFGSGPSQAGFLVKYGLKDPVARTWEVTVSMKQGQDTSPNLPATFKPEE